jgi:hypothetical protein
MVVHRARRRSRPLYGNGTEQLPEEIGGLAALRELPPTLGNLLELETLDLRANRLLGLPDELAQLARLRRLDLRWLELPASSAAAALEARGCEVLR